MLLEQPLKYAAFIGDVTLYMLQLMLCQSSATVSGGVSITASAEVSLPASREAVTVVASVSPAPQAEGRCKPPITPVHAVTCIACQHGEETLL